MRLNNAIASFEHAVGAPDDLTQTPAQQQAHAVGPSVDLGALYALDEVPVTLEAGAPAQPGAAKKAGKRKITDARRERNRKAQTRYRWKCKEEIQDLEQRVRSTQAALQDAIPRRSAAQALCETISGRLNQANTEYIRLVQQRGEAPAAAAAPPAGPAACTARAARGGVVSRALMDRHTASLDGVFAPEAAVAVSPGRIRHVPCGSERAVGTYPHAAPLSLGACMRHMHGGTGARGPGTKELALADAVDAYKAAEAAAAGIAATDTCWFVQSCYRTDGAPAAPCVAGGASATLDAAPVLSFSSGFASDECRLAYFVFFLAMSLEASLLTTEEDVAQACLAERVATDLKSQAHISLNPGPAKRSRADPVGPCRSPRSSASTATLADPLLHPGGPRGAPPPALGSKSTSGASGSTAAGGACAPAEAAHVSCDLADNPIIDVDGVEGCEVRCGLGGTCCAVTVTRRIFARLLADSLRHMRRTDVVTVCNQFLSFLRGVMGAGGSAPAEERGGADGVAGLGPLGLDLDSLAERILPPSARGDMHVAAVIQAAVDTVVTMLRGAPFDLMAEDRPQAGTLTGKARLQHVAARCAEVTSTWGFSWLTLLADAKRVSRALAVKAAGKHQEFAELVDVMYVRVYKAVGLSAEQRAFLADFWDTWRRRREALDGDLAAALSTTAKLPSPAHISADLLRVLDAAAAGARRDVVVPLYEPDPDDFEFAAPGLPATAVPRLLLGMSARSTRAAEDTALALMEVHRRDARQMEDFMSGFVLPAWFLTAAQRTRLNCAHVRHACVPMEMLVVCRMAAAEMRREGLAPPGRSAAGPPRRATQTLTL